MTEEEYERKEELASKAGEAVPQYHLPVEEEIEFYNLLIRGYLENRDTPLDKPLAVLENDMRDGHINPDAIEDLKALALKWRLKQ